MNPVMFNLGFLEIRWYSFFIILAILISTFFICREANKFDISKEFIINLIFWVVIMSLIGARLYFVLFNWDYYSLHTNEIYQIWNGGLAIHGGLIFGILTVLIYSLRYKVQILRLLDMIAPWMLFSQALGRWGNFFNAEAYGKATTLEHLQNLNIPDFIINGMNINGIYYTPTFLYESLWCLFGFIVLIIIKNFKHIRLGMLTALYLIWYGIGRFLIESSRLDSLMIANIKVAQIVSVIMFIFGLILLIVKFNKKGLDSMYNDDNENKKIQY